MSPLFLLSPKYEDFIYSDKTITPAYQFGKPRGGDDVDVCAPTNSVNLP